MPWSNKYGSRLEDSLGTYFVGNASGMDSPSELAKEVELGYVGIGWQLNNIPSHYSHLEKFEILEAQRIKKLRPGVKVGVLRNTEVATVFWDSANKTMYDPATQDYWTQCGGKPCVRTWISPAGSTPAQYFNYSNPAFVEWWLNVYIGEALRNPLIDAIYFDCCCGSPPADVFANNPRAVAQYKADAQAAFDRALAMIAAAGKWASAWNAEGGNGANPAYKGITQEGCKEVLDSWLEIGANENVALQALAIPFFANGHNPFKPTSASEFSQNNTIAAFLIARGASAMLELPVSGAFESMALYNLSNPLLKVDFGTPLGPGKNTSAGKYTREYTKATISLDCESWSSAFIMKPPPPRPPSPPSPPPPPPSPPSPMPSGWTPAYCESCENNEALKNLGSNYAIVDCIGACVKEEGCKFVNYAETNHEECILYAECKNPRRVPSPGCDPTKHEWWTTWAHTGVLV